MRRYIPILLTFSVFLLVACGGGGATNTSPPMAAPPTVIPVDTVTPFASITPENVISGTLPPASPTARPPAEGELPIALPGTLVSSATEDPNTGITFTQIIFTQTGGENQGILSITINGDGSVIRKINDQTATLQIKQTDVEELTAMIDKLNFFGMQATFMGPPANTNTYSYTLTIARADTSRTIQAQDGYIPDPLKAFFGKIVSLGQPGSPTFGTSPTPG